ncbi:MAG: zinc dependent phospholipase C family protein [Longimicrobiales bacterium]|nr:zinc dependent phospholipase C family protein [Longimicrobiales bacterium]
MPSVTLHLHLAEQLLTHWRRRPGDAPFPVRDPACANALRVGAMGPDMGFLPGGFAPLSDLAHCVRPGTLAGRVLDRARTPRQRAFAWGWVTHLLADLFVHPLVGCAVGEVVHGTPHRFVSGDRDPVNHMRVEGGLDAVYALRHPELRRITLTPPLEGEELAFLRRAYLEAYGAAPPLDRFRASHARAPRRMSQALVLAGLCAAAMPGTQEMAAPAPGPLEGVRAFLGRRSVAAALLLPAPPPLWLLNAVRDVEENFVELVLEEHSRGGSTLPEANLDTGRPWQAEAGHGGYRRATAYLASLGAEPLAPVTARGAA